MPETPPARKGTLFLFEFLYSFPTTFFLYGQPFYAKERYGWNAGQIGLTQAVDGFCIACGSYLGGWIAHRRNPRVSLRLGLMGAMLGALIGEWGDSRGLAETLVVSMAVFSFSQAMVWPGVEAALVQGETTARIQNLVAFYNIVWSLGSATAFLLATPIMDRWGLRSLFLLPLACFLVSLALTPVATKFLTPQNAGGEAAPAAPPPADDAAWRLSPGQRAAYRWLAWIANPMAYVAIIALVTFNPTVQGRLGLSFAEASVWGSLWFYVRTAAFEIFRRWSGWHYRWETLCLAFFLMTLSFGLMVTTTLLPVFLMAQVAFGLCIGLLYQSSLFYAMAGSDAQGEHGGIHEAFIGVGTMVGPLLIFGSGRLAPSYPALSVWLVLGLLSCGLTALLLISLRRLAAIRPDPHQSGPKDPDCGRQAP